MQKLTFQQLILSSSFTPVVGVQFALPTRQYECDVGKYYPVKWGVKVME